jgi:hypothetical protein
MKKIFPFLLLLLFHSSLSAQETIEIITTPPTGYVTYDQAFAQLNTEQVASGMLIDRSTPFVRKNKIADL